MGRSLFISDLHFGHNNVIKYDNRPFGMWDEMDCAMMTMWNESVNENDTIYILGDVSWHKVDKTVEILKSLNGHKILIKGNHDGFRHQYDQSKFDSCFDAIYPYLELHVNDRRNGVVLSHYPIPFFNHAHHGAMHLYGHVHCSFQWDVCEQLRKNLSKTYKMPWRMYNVGCMMKYMDYVPRTLDEIQKAFVDEELCYQREA